MLLFSAGSFCGTETTGHTVTMSRCRTTSRIGRRLRTGLKTDVAPGSTFSSTQGPWRSSRLSERTTRPTRWGSWAINDWLGEAEVIRLEKRMANPACLAISHVGSHLFKILLDWFYDNKVYLNLWVKCLACVDFIKILFLLCFCKLA